MKSKTLSIEDFINIRVIVHDRLVRLTNLTGNYFDEEIKADKELLKKLDVEIDAMKLDVVMGRK